MNPNNYSRPFDEDEEDDENGKEKKEGRRGDSPDYSFDGYKIEFSEKISLTPTAAPKQPK